MLFISVCLEPSLNGQKESTCPACKKGKLILEKCIKTGKKRWYCNNVDHCHYTAEDFEGSPIEHKSCPRCQRDMKLNICDEPFWSCTGRYEQRNKCTYTEPYVDVINDDTKESSDAE